MSFWEYFKSLGFTPILEPGPLAMIAEGGADELEGQRVTMLILRDQFFAEKCDDEMLVRFATARGIFRMREEPEEYYRQRIRFAYAWWSKGGRESAMQETMVQSFGFTACSVFNMRGLDPARWAEFRLDISGVTGDLTVSIEQIVWAANEVKPARSKLAGLKLFLDTAGPVPVIGAACTYGETIIIESGV